MSSNKLNILTVGTNPKLVYYSYKFQQTGKFNVYYINEDLTTTESVTLKDISLKSDLKLKPSLITTSFTDFNSTLQSSKIKFDIVFLSSNSLQDLTTVASNLIPFLNKSSIIIIESTGSVQLEPYLKNIPQFKELHLAVFSIVSTLDVRRSATANEYVVLTDLKNREIHLGEAQITPSKYGKGPQQNLTALSKLFGMDNKDSLRVTVKPTHQEFLTEQWKQAIPQICFDPLLILFEESSPLKLKEQILAKPLLSGLVTELITVSKSMGCKLPIGHDNESNLLRSWVESSTVNADSPLEYINAPKLFYDYFHSHPLNIDMVLLQPILLADDFGIKTPYLEFLYATLCRLEKMNYASLFFIRRDGVNAQIKENERISQELFQAKSMMEKLKRERDEGLGSVQGQLQQERESAKSLGLKLNENGQVLQNLQREFQLQGGVLQGAKSELARVQAELQSTQQQLIQAQQNQSQKRSSTSPLKSSRSSVNVLQQALAPPSTEKEEQQYSENGTPDLRDLRDVALFSEQLSATPRSTVLDANAGDISTSTVIQHEKTPSGEVSDIGNESSMSLKEMELVKKEQMLAMRELEFNKRLQQLRISQTQQSQQPQLQQSNQPPSLTQNTVFAPQTGPVPQQQQQQQQQPQGLQPALQPRLRQHSSAMQLNTMHNQQQFQSNANQNGNFRRVNSGMIMDAESYQYQHQGNVGNLPPFQPQMNGGSTGSVHQFRKADRKNRKSSMPLTSAANFQGGSINGPLKMNGGAGPNNGPRRATMTLMTNPMVPQSNKAFSAAMNANQFQQQQQQQFNSRIQAPQPRALINQGSQLHLNGSRSNSGNNSSDEKLTTPPHSGPQQQQGQVQGQGQLQGPSQPHDSNSVGQPQQPQVYKSNGGYVTPASTSSNTNTSSINASPNNITSEQQPLPLEPQAPIQDEGEVKPLGSISAGNKDMNYGESSKAKKKFGFFGKKKK